MRKRDQKGNRKESPFGSESPTLAKYDARTRYRYIEMLKNYACNPGTGKLGAVIDMLAEPLSEKECIVLREALIEHAKRMGLDTKRIEDNYREGRDSIPENLQAIGELNRVERHIRKEIQKAYRAKLAGGQRPRQSKSGLSGRLAELQRVFALSDDEISVLLAAYLAYHDQIYNGIIRDRNGLNGGMHNAFDRRTAITVFTGLPRSRIRQSLCRQSKLRKMGMLDEDLEPESEMSEFLHGLSDQPLTSKYFQEYGGDALPLDRHFAVRDHLDIIRRMVEFKDPKGSLNILLYGPPGAGKTEFCRSLAKDLGRRVFEVKHYDPDVARKEDNFRYRAVLACLNSVPQDISLIVVDEADNVLNEPIGFFGVTVNESSKGMLNDLLDNSRGMLIWITNHYDRIAASTRRRFDYAVKFPPLSQAQRRFAWQELLVEHGLAGMLSDREAGDLAVLYPLSIGEIDRVLRNCGMMVNEKTDPLTAYDILLSLLESQIKLKESAGERQRVLSRPRDDLAEEGFNVLGDLEIPDILSIVKSFTAKERVQATGMDAGNMSLLLHGPPGTGKTEFAKYLAGRIDRPMVARTASDLLDKYVGGTEQLIRDAFEEADREHAVLFIDEADSFLQERSRAQYSWQISQVNELLQQMERFRGVLICATNFKTRFDSAATRRFNLKVEFDYLTPEQREFFYRRSLAPLGGTDVPVEVAGVVRGIEYLTPGDFRVVHEQYRYLPPAKRTHRHLLDALRRETREKNGLPGQPIGFGR